MCMECVNFVCVNGTLSRDPDIREVNRFVFCELTIANTMSYNKQDGEKGRKTSWIKCKFLGSYMCEKLDAMDLRKGDKICVTGLLTQDVWEKDGKKVDKTSVQVTEVYLVARGNGGSSQKKKQVYDDGGSRGRNNNRQERQENSGGRSRSSSWKSKTKQEKFKDDKYEYDDDGADVPF